MKLGQFASPFFASALDRLASQQLPLKAAYDIKKVVAKFQEEAKIYEEVKSAIVKELAIKDEDGEVKKFPQLDQNNEPVPGAPSVNKCVPENLKLWEEKFTELNNLEIQVPHIKISDLGADVQISAHDLMALGEVISEELQP